LGQPVARLFFFICAEIKTHLSGKKSGLKVVVNVSAQVLQTKRSFLGMLLFPESAISLPESHRDGPLFHQKWG